MANSIKKMDLENLLDDAFDDLLKGSQGSATAIKGETHNMTRKPENLCEVPIWKDLLATIKEPDRFEESDSHAANKNNSIKNLPEELAQLLQFSGEGESGEEVMIENFVNALLSRDVLYEPLRELYDKYPVYLAEQDKKADRELAEEERRQLSLYRQQYFYLQALMQLWEKEDEADARKGAQGAASRVTTSLESLNYPMADARSQVAKTGDDPKGGPETACSVWELLQKIEACGAPPDALLATRAEDGPISFFNKI
jgi:Pex19 protein family